MKRSTRNALEIIYYWLEQHATCRNTYRAYFREFERLQLWLLSEDCNFTNVTSQQLSTFFSELAAGKLSVGIGKTRKTKRLTNRTVYHTKGVLFRMFEVLRLSSLRDDNPIANVAIDFPNETPELSFSKLKSATEKWHEIRKAWLARPNSDYGSRDPIERALAIAEISYWTAMQRRELAVAVMSDLKCVDGNWEITIRGTRKKREESLHFPHPAMEALKRYRISRGLSPTPNETERHVPLISRLKSEKAVDPWTITYALSKAFQQTIGSPSKNQAQISLTPRALRHYLIADGLSCDVSTQHLLSHTRSPHTLHTIVAESIDSTIRESFTKLSSRLAA
ncbi:MAG: hypothetical protein VB032_08155 [Burkholderiaceae bacterium]|nr:hypothetical protein [Burkholderiaceae bacterium]